MNTFYILWRLEYQNQLQILWLKILNVISIPIKPQASGQCGISANPFLLAIVYALISLVTYFCINEMLRIRF